METKELDKEQKEQELDNEKETLEEEFSLCEVKSDPIITEEGEQYPWILYNDSYCLSVYLYNDIFDPDKYTKLFAIIRSMDEDATIVFHINSGGGSLATLLSFLTVLRETQAYTIMCVDGMAMSAAAILAFAGDEIIVSPHASMLFHNVHADRSALQDGSRIKHSIDAMLKIYENLMHEYCSRILSDEDIESIVNRGSEFYFSGNEILEKLRVEEDEEPAGHA